jgi:hypothetical protein
MFVLLKSIISKFVLKIKFKILVNPLFFVDQKREGTLLPVLFFYN